MQERRTPASSDPRSRGPAFLRLAHALRARVGTAGGLLAVLGAWLGTALVQASMRRGWLDPLWSVGDALLVVLLLLALVLLAVAGCAGAWLAWRAARAAGGGRLRRAARLPRLVIALALPLLALAPLRFALPMTAQLLPHLVRAAAPDWRLERLDAQELRFAGRVRVGLGPALLAELRAGPATRTLRVGGPGGSGPVAERVALALRERGLATRAEGDCLSACTILFLGGRERTLAPGARLGFHAPATGRDAARARADARRVHARLGVAPAFVERVLATPSTDLWYPTEAELRAARILAPVD